MLYTLRYLILALAVCAVAPAACKKDDSSTGQPAQAAMGHYAEGYNKLLDKVKSVISNYESAFPAGPSEAMLSGKPVDKPHLFPEQNFAASAIREARQSFETAKQAAPPSMASLAKSADALIAGAQSVLALYAEAQKYYDAENYKDDKLAKGKELHGKFVAAVKQYREALGGLGGGLDKIEDEQAAEALKKFEGDKGYSFYFRKFNMEAKKLISATQKADNLAQLSALAAAYKPVDDLHAELAKFVAGKGSEINTVFSSYASTADRFDAECRKMLRAIKEAKPDALEPVGRAVESVIGAYNNLVSLGNSLYSVEDAGQLK